jgi:DNA-binding NarL/FixJ family response regulator
MSVPGSRLVKPWFLLPENPSEGLIETEEWIAIGELFKLTGRELDVAILLFHDKTRASMARRLNRSTGSVRKRIDKVFHKLNVSGRVGLVQRIWQVHERLVRQAGRGGGAGPAKRKS